jgi:uncharacterized membrane protein YGL010W
MRVDSIVTQYSPSHRSTANLIIHAATVPLFAGSGLALLSALSSAVHLPRWDLAFGLAALLCVLYARVSLRLAALLAPALAASAAAAHALAGWHPLAAALGGTAGILVALSAQRSGHRREALQVGFAGAWDFARRIAREQFYVAPLFLAASATGAGSPGGEPCVAPQ